MGKAFLDVSIARHSSIIYQDTPLSHQHELYNPQSPFHSHSTQGCITTPDAGRGSRVSQASHKTVFEFVDAEQGDKPVLPLLDKLPTRSRTDEAGQRRQVERDSTSIYPPARPGRPATLFRDLSGTPEGIALETTYSVKGKRTRRAGANRRSLETDVLDKYGVTVRSAMDGAVRKQATDPRHRAQLVAEAIARASEKGQEFKST